MLDFTGSNAKGKRPKGAMCRCMTVAAHNSGSWQSEALLWANDVNNSLSIIIETKEGQIEVADIVVEGSTLCPGVGFFDEALDVLVGFAGRRGDVLFENG
jgi:hypothetical protein